MMRSNPVFFLICPLLLGLLLAMPVAAGEASNEAIGSDRQPLVTLFSIDHCPGCLAAKQYFEKEGIAYQEFNIQNSESARETFERLGGRGTPLLVVGERVMHGFHPQRFEQFWQAPAQE